MFPLPSIIFLIFVLHFTSTYVKNSTVNCFYFKQLSFELKVKHVKSLLYLPTNLSFLAFFIILCSSEFLSNIFLLPVEIL